MSDELREKIATLLINCCALIPSYDRLSIYGFTDKIIALFPNLDEKQFREMLWINHGDCKALYGDDGEMQCNCSKWHNPMDFKRDSIYGIIEKILVHKHVIQSELSQYREMFEGLRVEER